MSCARGPTRYVALREPPFSRARRSAEGTDRANAGPSGYQTNHQVIFTQNANICSLKTIQRQVKSPEDVRKTDVEFAPCQTTRSQKGGGRLKWGGYALDSEAAPGTLAERNEVRVERGSVVAEPALRVKSARVREDRLVPVHEGVAYSNHGLRD